MSAIQPQPKLVTAPLIKSLSPNTATPGDTIVIDGQNFGAQQGTGYVHFANNGVNWGEPGNAAKFQLLTWSDAQISFLVPVKDSGGFQTSPGTTATVTVTNASGLTSNTMSLAIKAVPAPVIKSLSPNTAAPGDTIVIDGQNFAAQRGTGYVHFADNGVNWGEPGNVAKFQLLAWSDSQISFLVPVKDSGGFQTSPGTTATVTVTNASGLTSNAMSLAIKAIPAPVIKSLSPNTAAPGGTIVINGENFEAQQGTGYVHFADNGVNWGEPGNAAKFQLLSWSNTQISFLVPVKDSSGYQITPGTTATVTVTSGSGLTSNAVNLSLTSGAKWPVTADSGPTQIGTTGNGFMQTTVTIEQSGPLNASTHIWDKSGWGPFTGFHGGVAIRLYDVFGNTIGTFSNGPFGIEGGQDETKPWTAVVTPEERAELYSVAVVNFYDPQYNTPGSVATWIENNGPALAAVAAAVAGVAA